MFNNLSSVTLPNLPNLSGKKYAENIKKASAKMTASSTRDDLWKEFSAISAGYNFTFSTFGKYLDLLTGLAPASASKVAGKS